MATSMLPGGAFVKAAPAAIVAPARHGNRPFIAIGPNELKGLRSKREFTLILNDKAMRRVEI